MIKYRDGDPDRYYFEYMDGQLKVDNKTVYKGKFWKYMNVPIGPVKVLPDDEDPYLMMKSPSKSLEG